MNEKQIVLVVDDDTTLCQLAKKQLRIVGLEAQTASDGREAVALSKNKFAMIFMDLSMPEMSGFDATRAIRQLEISEGRARTPIIGLTANAEREKCIEAGMDDVVEKPMLLDQLRLVAKRFLQQ